VRKRVGKTNRFPGEARLVVLGGADRSVLVNHRAPERVEQPFAGR
jgi:hypothetical protein